MSRSKRLLLAVTVVFLTQPARGVVRLRFRLQCDHNFAVVILGRGGVLIPCPRWKPG